MPGSELLIAFFLATAVFAYMPGPAMLYAAAQTLARGRRAGWFAAIGIHIGGYVHVIAAAFGLALLFEAVPSLYLVLKIAGAAYLVWLGAKMILTNPNTRPDFNEISAKSPLRAFWDSVAVEVLNPKTAIFYLAFLPQFTDSDAAFPIALQLVLLGTIVNFMFSSADILCVLLAGQLSSLLRKSQSSGQIARKLGGSILIGLGTSIALKR